MGFLYGEVVLGASVLVLVVFAVADVGVAFDELVEVLVGFDGDGFFGARGLGGFFCFGGFFWSGALLVCFEFGVTGCLGCFCGFVEDVGDLAGFFFGWCVLC